MSTGTVRRGRQIKKGHGQKSTSSTRDSRFDGDQLEDFTCDSCQKTFLSKYTLLMHVFIHIDDVKLPPHICRVCGEVFASRGSLHLHSKIKENQCTATKKDCVLRSNNKRASSRKLQSVQCLRDTIENRLHNESRKSCAGSFQQVEIHTSEPERAGSYRNQTHMSIDATLSKRKQARAHTREGPNACHKSNTSLMSRSHLKDARRKSVAHPFKCNVCDRYFRYEINLQQHTVSHRKKLLLCNYCDRTFKRSVDLRTHTLSHTGEKTYVCKCGKSFALSVSLKSHERVHRGEGPYTEGPPYTCKVCFKSFANGSTLRKHAVVHTGERAYACGECDKAFKERSQLKRHSLLHTGEKPFKCRVCGVSFTQSGNLTRHIRVHTGVKPYKCDVCFKSFADRKNLKSHSFAYHAESCHKCDMCEKLFVTRNDLLQHVRVCRHQCS